MGRALPETSSLYPGSELTGALVLEFVNHARTMACLVQGSGGPATGCVVIGIICFLRPSAILLWSFFRYPSTSVLIPRICFPFPSLSRHSPVGVICFLPASAILPGSFFRYPSRPTTVPRPQGGPGAAAPLSHALVFSQLHQFFGAALDVQNMSAPWNSAAVVAAAYTGVAPGIDQGLHRRFSSALPRQPPLLSDSA